MSMKERVESEAQSTMRISNKDLICKDCKNRFNDNEFWGNTSRCSKFRVKELEVLVGGSCIEYEHE